MLHPFHQDVETLCISCTRCELRKPFAEGRVQRLVLRARNLPGPFDQVFVGAERDVFHTKLVYTAFVYNGSSFQAKTETNANAK